MIYRLLYFIILCLLLSIKIQAQPEPCGPDADMTSFCIDACVICDIDGFTGINNLTAQGQGFPEFCTIDYDNMQYIAFVAGTENLTIRVDVGTCTGGLNSLEVGFFESFDCENFVPVTDCDTDIPSNTSQTFSNNVPLVVGQYYYLIIDGSSSANCDWTFNVLDGSTEVLPLEDSGILTNSLAGCPDIPVTFTTTGEFGAASYLWTIDGIPQTENGLELVYDFPTDGTYEICVIASNVCDEAPPTCVTIELNTPETLVIDEVLCDGECVEANGVQFCETGFYQELITLPNGCDSLILINLEILPQPQKNLDLWICNDQSFSIGNNSYNQTGSYIDTVQTSDDCDSLIFLELLVIECEIIGTPDQIPVLCTGTATGTLIFSVDQGTPPLTYTYTNIEDTSITGTGMTNLLVNNEIPAIPKGIYQIYISDNFGNDVVVLQEITEPLPLSIGLVPSEYNGFNISCFTDLGESGDDGTLTANVSGGTPPYSYLWSDGQTSQTAIGLEAQNYSVVVSDLSGCIIEADFTLTAPSPIEAAVTFTDPNCDGENTGEIMVDSVAGGTPTYLYTLIDTAFFDNPRFTELSEGRYEVLIQDANGCIEIVEGTLTAADIPEIIFTEEPTICLGDSIQLKPFVLVDTLAAVAWTNASTLSCDDCLEPFARPFNNAAYTVFVSSPDECIDSTQIVIAVVKKRRIYVPNVFSPNDDGVNDKFFPFGGSEVAEIQSFNVFNRWGSQVYEATNFQANDPNFGWDGSFRGKKMRPAVFAWTASVLFLDGEVILYHGDVTILR